MPHLRPFTPASVSSLCPPFSAIAPPRSAVSILRTRSWKVPASGSREPSSPTLAASRLYTTASIRSNRPQTSSRPSFPGQRRSNLITTRTAVRYCSHRRNMCRYRDAGDAAGAVDLAMGREVLPKNVKPLHYHLRLEPDLEKFTFEGEVTIECVSSYDIGIAQEAKMVID